jgi:hypothetical protein
MKKLAILAGLMGLVFAADATPFEVGGADVAKTGSNNAADDFAALQAVINAWNSANPSNQLPVPVSTGEKDSSGPNATGLSGFTYAVLHYGTGPGGANPGGGLEVWDLNGASSFDFPANGSGPNGFGGFSSIRLYDANPNLVPDGGTTVVMLGAVISGLGLLRRKRS